MTVRQRLIYLLDEHRPPGTRPAEVDRLAGVAARWRTKLAKLLAGIGSAVFELEYHEVDELELLMTELAEDLHTDAGLWRTFEEANLRLFASPLPLLWRPGDAPLARFDARRFQAFLHGVWRHLQPDAMVAMRHRGFERIAEAAATFFAEAWAGEPPRSPVAVFLDAEHRRGWDVKRKLVWLGTDSFLLRLACEDYLCEQDEGKGEVDEIVLMDDFLAQECTTWAGLGALELLAARLDLTAAERADLLGWHARHAALYRVEQLAARGAQVETMRVTNLINERPYVVRMELPRAQCPFEAGQTVFGSLVPWRGEWYWSGAQRFLRTQGSDAAEMRRQFIEKHHRIVYRYRSDLEAKAREFATEQHTAFVGHYGSDLAVFPDGLAMAAAEQGRMRRANEARAAVDEAARAAMVERDPDGAAPRMELPDHILRCRGGVAVFSHPVEGWDIMLDYDRLCAGLRCEAGELDDEQREVLQSFMESPSIGPDFVRRVVAQHGWRGLAELYYVPADEPLALEWLLRRFKGAYYRPRLPNLALVGAE